MAVLFGLGLASLLPPLTASAMNSAPDSQAGLASGVNNAVARVAGLLWIAALPPITGLTGAAYTDPVRFRSSFAEISWICAAAFTSAAAVAATFITRPGRAAPARRPALIQTPVPAPRLPCRHRPCTGGKPADWTGSMTSGPSSGGPGYRARAPIGSQAGSTIGSASRALCRPAGSALLRAAISKTYWLNQESFIV